MNYRRRRRGVRVILLASTAAAAIGLAGMTMRDDGSASSSARETAAPVRTVTTSTATAAAVTSTPNARPTAPGPAVRRVYGRGARAVAVVRPQGIRGPLPGVLFLHGWGYQRPRDYRRWIEHLARRGNAVIVPKYQNGLHSDPTRVRGAMLRGVRTALQNVKIEPGTLVVAGHSAGAAMAADYAAVAASHGLPRPRAVYAAYPGRRILGTPGIPAAGPGRIGASTRLLVLAGVRDVVVGQAPARDLRARATAIPTSRRRFVLVRDPRVSDHLAPLRGSRAARRTFWRHLDRLIAAARGTQTP